MRDHSIFLLISLIKGVRIEVLPQVLSYHFGPCKQVLVVFIPGMMSDQSFQNHVLMIDFAFLVDLKTQDEIFLLFQVS
jgi:hypothetical protein